MSLSSVSFEVQRLWTAWPLSNAQANRSLFRASADVTTEDCVEAVHVTPGHVFIVRQPSQGPQELYAFDNVPRSSAAQPPRVPSLPGSTTDYNDMRSALLTHPSAPLVSVCSCPQRPHRVYLVEQQGAVEVWEYSPEKRQWKERESDFYRLGCAGPVRSAVLLPKQDLLVWSEGTEGAGSCLALHRVKQQLLQGDRDQSLQSCSLILSDVTDGTLSVLASSVHIATRMKKFSYFWFPREDVLVPFLWETPLPLSVSQLKAPCNHKRITLQLVTPLSKETPPPSGFVVATTVHPATQQLIVLADNGTVHSLEAVTSGPRRRIESKKIAALVDFKEHLPFFSSQLRGGREAGGEARRGSSPAGRLELFVHQSYIGIVNRGVVRLYEGQSGEMVWSHDEHEGSRTRLWRCGGRVPSVGLWTPDSLWILRSPKVLQQAEFLVKGQFPITTNADGTTPWDFLASGPKFAAKLCRDWGLKMWSSKYALDEIYEMVTDYRQKIANEGGNVDAKRPHLSEVLLDTALDGLQNPGLILAFLADIPECQHSVVKRIEAFLDSYKSTSDQVSPLQTPLNRKIAPLLEEYLKVYHQYRQQLNNFSGDNSESVFSASEEVKRILTSFYRKGDSLHDSVAMGLKSHFEQLSITEPEQALKGIREYLEIESFVEACQGGPELPSGDHDWRLMLMSEPLPSTLGLDPQPPSRIHLFETICRLLYRLDPEDLVPFIVFIEEARNRQYQQRTAYHRQVRQGFYWQRALECLPLAPGAPPSAGQERGAPGGALVKARVRTKCKILIQSEASNAKMAALVLLLEHRLWSDAVEFYSSVVMSQDDVLDCVKKCLYQALITAFMQGGVYSCYHQKLSSLMPDHFNIQAYLTAVSSISETEGEENKRKKEMESLFVSEEDSTAMQVKHVQESLSSLLFKEGNCLNPT